MRGIRTVLRVLDEHPEGLRNKDITDLTGDHAAQTTQNLIRLERQGYVQRAADGTWHRKK